MQNAVFTFLPSLRPSKRVQHCLGATCEKSEMGRSFLSFFFLISFPLTDLHGITELLRSPASKEGRGSQGYLFTTWTQRLESPFKNERAETDESGKEGRTALIPSCLLCHPPRGKFNKVHIPRATKERDENT